MFSAREIAEEHEIATAPVDTQFRERRKGIQPLPKEDKLREFRCPIMDLLLFKAIAQPQIVQVGLMDSLGL